MRTETLERFLSSLKTTHPTNPHKLYWESINEKLPLLELPQFFTTVQHTDFDNYHYTLEVEVFKSCYDDYIGIFDYIFLDVACKCIANGKKYESIKEDVIKETMRHLSDFLYKLYAQLTSPDIKKQIVKRTKHSNRVYRNMCNYVDALFANYSRLEAVRVDFNYLQDSSITLEQFEMDLQRFYDHSRKDSLFDNLRGHIMKLEYGLMKGLHAHILLFFDGSKHQNSWILAKKVGEYWQKITDYPSQGWNCHSNIKRYQELGTLGIGTIYANDIDKIKILKKTVITYFCNPKQFIKPKNQPKMKLIRRGDMPVMRDKKLGRPRKCESDNCDNGG